ncbi:hypothetical protein GCM10007415_03700 [Parapedobacter pyrenivorans]|uniref:DUF937 domain-containing protein n=1 Tax=Parapedobacter pyrenivorans TaxID=1305674 RepID=A0A917HCL4_9SPHI|nr:DUF937 domain-containing protein [Parapedobacter pyrenivorans]GGG75309.1 hypothetical protein GCM10007415_03700 [Parapedobacter pyrenivorans]
MEKILDLLNGSLGKEVVEGITRNTEASEEQTKAVVSNALPALLGALQNNASNSDGAQGILNAIGSKHDGGILDNLSGFLGSNDTSDGNGILGHMLGDKRDAVEHAISGKTGVSSGTVSKILAMLAPVVMGYLGKQSRNGQVNDGNGLNDLLGGMLGGQSGGNILGGLLDQNGDGKLGVDDVGGLLGGFFGKK